MRPATTRRPRVVLVQTLIPDYRTPFLRELLAKLGSELVLISGTEDWSVDVSPADDVPYVHVRNRYFGRRQLLWQSGVLRPALTAHVTVLGLNPRIVSSWVALVGRRIRGRRTVLWGHAWPRRGSASRTDVIRKLMRRLADTMIVYTETEATQLRATSSSIDVVAAPNALYPMEEIGPEISGRPTDFLFVGRLNPAKKPELLLEAFRLAEPSLPRDVRLVFVGDGPLRDNLETRARTAGLTDRVVLLGHLSDTDSLRRAYGQAIASVSPGYVGLSVIQSLGYGVPMLVARDEPHAPEIEAVVEGENAMLFREDTPESLAALLVAAAEHREHWLARRSSIAAQIRSTYCVENMVAAFISGLRLDTVERVDSTPDGSTRLQPDGRDRTALE
jgi:glycosyltransferase involved in cell wall biosynthesis